MVLTVHRCLPTCFYFSYEAEFVQSLLKAGKKHLAQQSNFTQVPILLEMLRFAFLNAYIIQNLKCEYDLGRSSVTSGYRLLFEVMCLGTGGYAWSGAVVPLTI